MVGDREGVYIYAATVSHKILQIKVDQENQIKELEKGHTADVGQIILSNTGEYLYSCGKDGKILEYNTSSGRIEFVLQSD